jgi:Thrombospondin type 3 repeat
LIRAEEMMTMRTKWMLASFCGAIGLVLAATLAGSADLQPMVVTSVTGTLRIQQSVPCAADVDITRPVTGGRLELTPADGLDVAGGKAFALTRLNLAFAPFSVHRDCLGFGETRDYTAESVELGRTVSFTASPSSPGVYPFTIPKADFQIYQGAIVNGTFDTGYKRPSEDVTGTIDFNLGTVQMHAVVATRVHFEAGCSFLGCIINEDRDGTLTVDISGAIAFPDSDGDGVPDRSDNCKFVPNPTQSVVPTPVVTPPFNLTLHSCTDHRIGRAIGADVCDGGPVIVTNNAPLRFAIGPNVVTWQGEDAIHRTATATQTVTVVDTTPPIFTFVPPHIDLNNCGSPPLGLPTAIDDCAGAVTFTNDAPPTFLVGTTVVTWTATDVSGNHATATQTVTVVDTVAPTVSCVPTNPTGSSFVVTATDACSSPIIRLGSFVLANGETIKINETGQPGVRLVNDVSSDHLRHFQVGKGEAVITATDPSSNVGTVVCR